MSAYVYTLVSVLLVPQISLEI